MKKSLKKIILSLCIMIITSHAYSQSYCDSNPVDIHGDLSVVGNKIVDQNNSAVSFAGNSMFWSNTNWGAEKFYNADVVSWLKNDWGSTIVRAAMGVEDFGGYLSDPTANKDRVTTVVDAAIAEGMYVIIDWHSHNAENYESQAVEFFQEMARTYGNQPNVIYEVYNEPISTSWSAVKSYSETVISAIRAIDPDNLIIVGSPTWSQDVDIASNDPITSSTNIAYTLHFYAGTHGASLRAKAQTALNNGIALMATEWGTVNADGNGNVDNNSTDEWMTFLQENDISHLNWSVNDKSEGASIVNSGASESGNWSSSDLTSSGTKVKSIIESWAEYCDGEPIVIVDPEPIVYTAIPSIIQAEDYASHSGTQLENTQDSGGGENVGYIETNDSLSYNIEAPTSGDYIIDFRVASLENGASFDIFSGNTIIGNISSSATGDWQAWETVSETVTLNQGEQTIKLVATGSGWNINWLEFSENEGNTTSLTVSSLSQFSAGGESKTIVVNSNVNWTVSENTSWISVDNANGSNDGSISVTTSENTSTDDRSAIITISGSGITRSVSVSQEGADDTEEPNDSLTVSSLSQFSADGESKTVTISSNINWTVSENTSWISVNSANGSNNGSISVTTSENTSTNDRSATITISGSGIMRSVSVSQEGADDTEEPNGTNNCSNITTWSPSTVYSQAGTRVVYENNIYENKWYTLNQNPITFSVNSWDLWTFIGTCSSNRASENTDLEDENLIKVFHNSSTKSLNIYVDNTNDYSSAAIFDAQGRKILNQKLNQSNSEISLEGYKNGIYFIKVSGQKTFAKTIIKK